MLTRVTVPNHLDISTYCIVWHSVY